MIGHYLLTLCPAAEHDVLTGKMRPGDFGTVKERCLVGWAADTTQFAFNREVFVSGRRWGHRPQHLHTAWRPKYEDDGRVIAIECQYDDLCARFGIERTNRAIRNRILNNQARRELRRQGEMFQPAEMVMVCDG